MKDVPEIAPEVRGLLEEIVANPRSAIRLAPRRALRSWFDSDEMVRATDVSRDKAVRHLVAAHRNELAALLQEASWISYWKAPVLAHRPVGADGELYDPTQREPHWRRRVEREVLAQPGGSKEIELLRQCLVSIGPGLGLNLAKAALALIPSDRTRYYVGLSVPWNEPRTAVAIFSRLAREAHPRHTQQDALLSLAARICSLGLLTDARSLYRRHAAMAPESPYGRICSFNLSCYLGEKKAAASEAHLLSMVSRADDPIIAEERELLRNWARTKSRDERNRAIRVGIQLSGRIPEVAEVLCHSIEP